MTSSSPQETPSAESTDSGFALDWQRASRRAAMLMSPGPRVTKRQAVENVASIRSAMRKAPELVGNVTGLHQAAEIMAQRRQLVVDRPGWATLNAQMFAHMTDGHLPVGKRPWSQVVVAEQLGSALALLGTRVLGQYQPFNESLVIVAPTVIQVQRELALDPADFHLWVSAHEATHGLQFAAAPWLVEWMQRHVVALMDELQEVIEPPSGRETPAGTTTKFEPSGLIAGLSPQAAAVMENVTALMSLLEGHADVVMDEVGPRRIPSVRHIRQKFNKRRNSKKPLAALLNRLLGMDEKLAQYRDGAKFCRTVIAQVDHEGLNAVFDREENLPTLTEIHEPELWLARVHAS